MSRTKAKFSNEVKESILMRDNYMCVLCNSLQVADIHHVYFGLESNVDETRNNTDNGVTLCRSCHNDCHACKSGQGKRQEAINYITSYYEK